MAKVQTQNNNQYERMVITPYYNYVTFRVQTCSDAHVALYHEEGSDKKYEIILGRYNRRIEIYRRPDDEWEAAKSVDTWMLFDCYSYRYDDDRCYELVIQIYIWMCYQLRYFFAFLFRIIRINIE